MDTLMVGVPGVSLSVVGMGRRYDPGTRHASRRHGHIVTLARESAVRTVRTARERPVFRDSG
ncbi:hypothetical protein Kisp01_16300 [Kineosporia sp. NBRC 101677]|nr:hypothetical protein Kisp01_16300 [Kineosporia sp. NBRC 101677]